MKPLKIIRLSIMTSAMAAMISCVNPGGSGSETGSVSSVPTTTGGGSTTGGTTTGGTTGGSSGSTTWHFDNAADYTIDQIVTPVPLVDSLTISGTVATLNQVDQLDSDGTVAGGFGAGAATYAGASTTNMQYSSGLTLTSPQASGVYTSRCMDAGGSVSWSNLSWSQDQMYGIALPDSGFGDTSKNESGFLTANIPMSTNVLLLHFDNNYLDTSGQGHTLTVSDGGDGGAGTECDAPSDPSFIADPGFFNGVYGPSMLTYDGTLGSSAASGFACTFGGPSAYGTGQLIEVQSSGVLNNAPVSNRTISFWWRPTNVANHADIGGPQDSRIIFEIGDADNGMAAYTRAAPQAFHMVGWSNDTTVPWYSDISFNNINDGTGADNFYHIALVLDNGGSAPAADKFKAYVNGVEVGSEIGGQISASAEVLAIGNISGTTNAAIINPIFSEGDMVEFAVWNEAFDADQIAALYRRHFVTNIDFQIKNSPTDETCAGAANTFEGYLGTNGSYYNQASHDIENSSKTTPPSFDISAVVPDSRFIQYKVDFDTTATDNGDHTWFSPLIGQVYIESDHYFANIPTVVPNTGQAFTDDITGFNTTLALGNISFQLSPDDGTTWYWHNGSNWAVVAEPSEEAPTNSTSATLIDLNISTFIPQTLGAPPQSGTLKWRAFFDSNNGSGAGTASASIDAVSVDYTDI